MWLIGLIDDYGGRLLQIEQNLRTFYTSDIFYTFYIFYLLHLLHLLRLLHLLHLLSLLIHVSLVSLAVSPGSKSYRSLSDTVQGSG